MRPRPTGVAHGRQAVAALAFLLPTATMAQLPGAGALDALTRTHDGRIAHYSSWDRQGRNEDFVAIAPGQTVTLVDHEGAGVVRRWWLTIAPRDHRELQRKLIVRAYWDGETTPSVEVPVSDFFGMGFGEWHDYVSLPLSMTSGGYTSYWAMPFGRRARITVENGASVAVERFYFNVDIETRPTPPAESLYFHAQFRRATTVRGTPVTILETTGRGHYVGTLLSMQPRRGNGLGYLEGNERVFVDGEATPSIIGTGTEDYFNSGWYYDTGIFSAPYHGVTVKDTVLGRINTYRWHVEDPIPFRTGLRFEIEHGGSNDAPNVDYTSVAYWYQTHPRPPFPALPADLMPVVPAPVTRIEGLIEGESLLAAARVTAGELRVQDMRGFDGEWSGGAHLWWVLAAPGARLTLPLEAPAAGTYELVGHFTRAQDYGNVRVHVNGRPLAPVVEGYNPFVAPSGPISFGRVPLRAGANEVVLEIVGKDRRAAGYSDGYLVGLDGFVLRR